MADWLPQPAWRYVGRVAARNPGNAECCNLDHNMDKGEENRGGKAARREQPSSKRQDQMFWTSSVKSAKGSEGWREDCISESGNGLHTNPSTPVIFNCHGTQPACELILRSPPARWRPGRGQTPFERQAIWLGIWLLPSRHSAGTQPCLHIWSRLIIKL